MIAKERKKHEGVGAYKDELCAKIETRNALAAQGKEEKATRWNELKSMEDEKLRAKFAAQAKMVKAKERSLAFEEERLAKDNKAGENPTMFVDQGTMDAVAWKCWELAREEILAQKETVCGGGTTRWGYGGGHGGHGGGREGEGDGNGGDGDDRVGDGGAGEHKSA
nr:uncharacterized protein LOC109775766 [Aegilops tauschii subsp. strangulata]